MTEAEERELRISVMQADLLSKQADTTLKTKQSYWETPKALAIIIGATAAVFSVMAGLAGYKLASTPPAQVFQLPPGTTITVAPAR